jgi:hypothetical protein
MAANNEALREAFDGFAVTRKEKKDPLRSLLFGTVWLAFVSPADSNRDTTGRTLRLSTETEEERDEREEQERRDGHLSRNHPKWIRSAVTCSKTILQLERQGRGPGPALRERFPSPSMANCSDIAAALLDVAFSKGLVKDTCTEFKKWLSKY